MNLPIAPVTGVALAFLLVAVVLLAIAVGLILWGATTLWIRLDSRRHATSDWGRTQR